MNARAGELRPVESDPLEQVGQRILELIQKASEIAEQNSQNAQNATSAANGLAFQLRASEERIRELEAALRFQYARADRAEEWLKRISTEIAQTLPSPQPATSSPAASAHPEIELYVKGRRKVS